LRASLALSWRLWHFEFVKKRLFQRWFVVLGMLAMLSALIAAPMSSTYALAMTGAAPAATSEAMADMPCHQPAKRCPNCPQKVCPDMGTCMVKCFQPLNMPVSETRLPAVRFSLRLSPASMQATAGSITPPLLRPPSV
jgi:hypothetical protein